MELEILNTSVQIILLSWTGIIIRNGIKDIANQVLWSCALCRENKNPCSYTGSLLHFAQMQNIPPYISAYPKWVFKLINSYGYWSFASRFIFLKLIFRLAFSRSVCIGLLPFFSPIDSTALVNREPLDLWACAISWVNTFFYWLFFF